MKQEVNLLSEVESRKLQESLQEFQQLYPNSTREISVKPLLHGVAAHHAGCLPIWRTFIEELFQKGLLKVVFSTETLAAGINMPARYGLEHFNLQQLFTNLEVQLLHPSFDDILL